VAAQTAPAAFLSLPRPQGFWYALVLLLSALQPVLGLTLAVLYARQEDRSARVFGYWCLALGILGWTVAAMTGAAKAALGSGEWFVQPYY
jgi:hypothetical protein